MNIYGYISYVIIHIYEYLCVFTYIYTYLYMFMHEEFFTECVYLNKFSFILRNILQILIIGVFYLFI